MFLLSLRPLRRAYRVLPRPLVAIQRAMRVVFAVYLVVIGGTLAFYIAVGLLHR